MRRDVFQAIADPTRRQILDKLSRGQMNLNTLADGFAISRPAISKHIKILTECGLVKIKQTGRERFCEPQFRQLSEVADFIGKYQAFWNNKLDRLDKFLTENNNQI